MFPTQTFSKIIWEKLYILNSYNNGRLTSFDVLITTHTVYVKIFAVY